MLEGSTPAIRKERLLARVLVRTTLSRYYTSLQLFPLSKLDQHTCEAQAGHQSTTETAAQLVGTLESVVQQHRTHFVMLPLHRPYLLRSASSSETSQGGLVEVLLIQVVRNHGLFLSKMW